MEYKLINPLVSEIKGILDTSPAECSQSCEQRTAWRILENGEIIVRYEQNGDK